MILLLIWSTIFEKKSIKINYDPSYLAMKSIIVVTIIRYNQLLLQENLL